MAEATLQKVPANVGSYTHGAFVWHEFGAQDLVAAQRFYGELFGWTFQSLPMGDMVYHMIHLGDQGIGGMYQVPAGTELPTSWLGSVSVTDVDAAVKIAEGLGGKVIYGPMDIEGIGRYATILDPEGAVIGLFRSLHGDPDTSTPKVGEFCWDGLLSKDLTAAADFYKAVIGWSTSQAWEGSGEKVFKMGDKMEASLAEAKEGVHPTWLTYVHVADLAASKKKASELGAKIIVDNVDLPFGSFSVIHDPMGGLIGLFQGKEA